MSEAIAASSSAAPSLLGNYRLPHAAYDEAYARDGSVRPQWEYLLRSLAALGADEIARRGQEVRRLLRESGVTYNVYDDPQRQERPWPLDPIPALLTSAEWYTIEQSLIQRAELLELVLRDLYGPRTLIRRGVLPPELIYGHPGFLLPCVGVSLPGGRHLPLYAADLARTPDGNFIVIGDRTQAPSGAGYALENRAVLSRVLPTVYRDSQVHRLPPFFRRLRTILARLAPQASDTPEIVLLTPGPSNETYFEHAYLASNLGCTLAPGEDLTVRDQRLWLRTVEGNRPIDVVVRRVDDTFCDPLELRADSVLGTPGLLQAVRAQQVSIINPLGSSVVENPGLMPFLPALARQLLGEELKLPSLRTWWCGDADARAYVLENLEQLVVKPIFPHTSGATIFGTRLSVDERHRLAEKIRAQPHLYVGQEYVPLSTVPVFVDGRLEPRVMVIRSFLLSADDGYDVMPGGLCRVAPTADGYVVSNQYGGVSKDLWVLASEPEPDVQLSPTDRPAFIVAGGEEVSGRVADNLFWFGRYSERSEGMARLLREVLRRVLDVAAVRDDARTLALFRVMTAAIASAREAGGVADHRAMVEELAALLFDVRRTGSLRFNVSAIGRTGRWVRDRLSGDALRVISALDRELTEPVELREAMRKLEQVLLLLAAVAGVTTEGMRRGDAWSFMHIGRCLERGLIRIAAVRALLSGVGDPGAVPWEVLLLLSEGSLPPRFSDRSIAQPGTLLSLVLTDERHPRSLVYQLRQLVAWLPRIARQQHGEQPSRDERLVRDALEELERNRHAVDAAAVGPTIDPQLDALLAGVARRLMSVSDQLSRRYFNQAEFPQQLVRVV